MAAGEPGNGLEPDEVKAAYHASTSPTAGAGTTVAIVTAYHNPTAEADLAVFNKRFGLPDCTVANGCFTQVSPRGMGFSFTSTRDWMIESALDVQWVHAIAPGARILLVEARNGEWPEMLAAVEYAATRAQYVAMSWGSPEFPEQAAYDRYFARPGVNFFASSGDRWGKVYYPSSSPRVVSVGGTVMKADPSLTPIEFAWPSSGWGCSAYEAASPAQRDTDDFNVTNCGTRRSTPDIALVADPGLRIYWNGSWRVAGGTSASNVIVAARSAASGMDVTTSTVYGSGMSFRAVQSPGAPRSTAFDPMSGRGSWVGAVANPEPVAVKPIRPRTRRTSAASWCGTPTSSRATSRMRTSTSSGEARFRTR